MDELTLHAAREWLDHRRRRRPDTANPHLLINKFTALGTGPVSADSLTAPLRGQAATLEQLRVDRQLEEALPHGPAPSTSPRSSDSMRRLRSGTRAPPALSWSETWNPIPRLHHEPAGPTPDIRPHTAVTSGLMC
ncbi:hypothetical protein ACIRQP_39105 [Streptomyces sp. NPDC102274]|uniref:hypothetical protein n=1 Tax=Streptomyces sp. NPDC102274 TaxID=3366151 RepID=UPI0037F676E7